MVRRLATRVRAAAQTAMGRYGDSPPPTGFDNAAANDEIASGGIQTEEMGKEEVGAAARDQEASGGTNGHLQEHQASSEAGLFRGLAPPTRLKLDFGSDGGTDGIGTNAISGSTKIEYQASSEAGLLRGLAPPIKLGFGTEARNKNIDSGRHAPEITPGGETGDETALDALATLLM